MDNKGQTKDKTLFFQKANAHIWLSKAKYGHNVCETLTKKIFSVSRKIALRPFIYIIIYKLHECQALFTAYQKLSAEVLSVLQQAIHNVKHLHPHIIISMITALWHEILPKIRESVRVRSARLGRLCTHSYAVADWYETQVSFFTL